MENHILIICSLNILINSCKAVAPFSSTSTFISLMYFFSSPGSSWDSPAHDGIISIHSLLLRDRYKPVHDPCLLIAILLISLPPGSLLSQEWSRTACCGQLFAREKLGNPGPYTCRHRPVCVCFSLTPSAPSLTTECGNQCSRHSPPPQLCATKYSQRFIIPAGRTLLESTENCKLGPLIGFSLIA